MAQHRKMPVQQAFTFNYEFSRDEYAAALRDCWRADPQFIEHHRLLDGLAWKLRLGAIITIAGAVAAIAWGMSANWTDEPIAVALAAVAVLICVFAGMVMVGWVDLRTNIHLQAQLAAIGPAGDDHVGRHHVEFAEGGIVLVGPQGPTKWGWWHPIQLVELESVVVARRDANNAVLLPRRVFASESEIKAMAECFAAWHTAALARDGAVLLASLAKSDAACPQCQYNLRGVTSLVCPECGLQLSRQTLPGLLED